MSANATAQLEIYDWATDESFLSQPTRETFAEFIARQESEVDLTSIVEPVTLVSPPSQNPRGDHFLKPVPLMNRVVSQ